MPEKYKKETFDYQAGWQLLNALFDASEDLIFVCNLSGNIITSNRQASVYLQQSPEELNGRHLFMQFQTSTADEWSTVFSRTIESGEEGTFPFEHAERFFTSKIHPLLHEDGTFDRIVVTCRDITAEVRNNERARQEHIRLGVLKDISDRVRQDYSLHEIAEYAVDALSQCIDDCRVAYSEIDKEMQMQILFSREPEEMPHIQGLEADLAAAPEYVNQLKSLASVITSDVTEEPLLEPLQRELRAGKTRSVIDVPVVNRRGLLGLLCLDCSHPRTWDSSTVKLLEQTADLLRAAAEREQRQHAEQKLRETSQWLQSTFAAMEDAVFIASADRRLIDMNDAAVRMFGYTKSQLEKLTTDVLHVDEDHKEQFQQRLSRELQNRSSAHFQYVARRNDGEVFPTEHSISLLRDSHNTVIGLVSVVRDISQRMERERRLKELTEGLQTKASELLRKNEELASINKELEAYAYTVSHDLKKPVLNIRDYCSLLMQKDIDEKDRTHFIGRIDAITRRAHELITDLLWLSRAKSMELEAEELNFTILAREVCSAQTSLSDREFTCTVAENMYFHADRRLMLIVLENLVGNAIKFASEERHPVIDIGSTTIDGAQVWYIRDNGVGFDPQLAVKIFEPFERAHDYQQYPGTGIGLATVRRIIRRHQGSIWAESQPDKGTTVFFTLPSKAAA